MALEGASHAQIYAAVDKLILPPLLEAHDHNLSSLADALEKNRDTLRKQPFTWGLLRRLGEVEAWLSEHGDRAQLTH